MGRASPFSAFSNFLQYFLGLQRPGQDQRSRLSIKPHPEQVEDRRRPPQTLRSQL
jgi:hypothetical protein